MSADHAVQHLDHICRQVTVGRAAARELAQLAGAFDLKEPEFRLLWRLSDETLKDSPEGRACGLDQASLAESLGCSPAQVSALVERQRVRGTLVGCVAPGDRRRQIWQITPAGSRIVLAMIDSVGQGKRQPAHTLSMVDQVSRKLRDSA